MPSNKDFTVSILVGGVELPEYENEGQVYVESNLFTPVSYTQQSEELVQDEIEKQSWPVTPYQIKVTAGPNTPYSYYKIYVDGQKATQIAVKPSCSCISEGFYDGVHITEFLFSLPRFPKGKKDRLDKGKASKVGLIEVECWNSKVTGYKKPMINKLEYSQANKKDSTNVTNGDYMMATTKVGRSVRSTQKSMVEDWTLFNVRSRLSVKYVMGHSLIDMGFRLRPIRIPIHRIPASIVTQPVSTTSKRKKPGPLSSKKNRPPWKVTLTPTPEDDVIAIDSDGSDEIIVGDFVPSAKKQKCDNSDDEAVMEVSESDGQRASTSEEATNEEKTKDANDKNVKEKDEEEKKDENDKTSEEEKSQTDEPSKKSKEKADESSDKETKTDETEKESTDGDKDKASKSSSESVTEEGDKDRLDTSDDKEDGGSHQKEVAAEDTAELNDKVDEEKEKSEEKENNPQENTTTESEIKDEVIEHVENEGQSEAKNAEENVNESEKDKEADCKEKNDDDDDAADFIKEIAKFEPLEPVVEDQPKTSSDGGETESRNKDDAEAGDGGSGDIGGQGDGDCGVQGIGDNGDAEGCGESVLDVLDCLSADALTVDPGGTFGDELILD